MVETKVKKKKSKLPLILGGTLVVAAIGAYVGVALHYQNYFLPNTVINNIEAENRTWDDVQRELESVIDSYKLTITGRNGITDTITSSDISMDLSFGDAIKKAQQNQDEWKWPLAFFNESTVEFGSELSYSEERLEEKIASMNCMDETKALAPTDAHLSEFSKETGLTIIPEEENNKLKDDVFLEMVKEQLNSLGSEITLDMLEKADAYLHPSVYSDDATLTSIMEQTNELTKATITYRFDDNVEVVDGETIYSWLVTDENNQISVDADLAREFVNSLARKYDSFNGNGTREFKTSYGQTVSITGGDYGWWMQRATTTNELLAAIEAGEDCELTPVYNQTAASYGDADYGDTYVEVNLTAQHLFLYVKGKLVLETDFVSGKPSVKNTPTGVYSITYKTRAHTMNGTDDDPYRVETSFWMPFAGNVGLHDATWRTVFGGTLYKSSGSHGCINLPYNAAKTIYQNVDKGTAVIVYTLAGTEKKSTTSQGDREIAQIGIDAIDRIGTITKKNYESSKEKVEWARQVYSDLNATQRAMVTNYQTLVQAEATIKSLK